jgi:putative transposase
MIAPEARLSVTRQCALLGIARSSFYYRSRPEPEQELDVLKRLDRIFTNDPVYGSRRLQVALLREGISIGRRRVRRLMRKLGLWAVRPKRNTSKRHPEHKVYPYLLRGKIIDQPNQVWAADVTYIPMQHGFLYLVAIIDWATRWVLSWRLSNTLTTLTRVPNRAEQGDLRLRASRQGQAYGIVSRGFSLTAFNGRVSS